MCYRVFVIEEHCEKGHPHEVRVCWRQCRPRAAESYETGEWNNLCVRPQYGYPETEIFSPTATEITDCAICHEIETGNEGQILKRRLEEVMAPHNNVEHHIKEFQQRIDEIEHRISHQHLSEGQIYILRSTQADCQGRIDILDVVQSNRVDTIESIEAALERLEEVVQGIRYKDAERNARTHVGPPLIYYGSLPDEQEKGVRSASDDYPRHIPPEDHDLPMDQWGVYQEEVAVGQYDASEDDLSQEEVME